MSFQLGFTLAAAPGTSSSKTYLARLQRFDGEEALVEIRPFRHPPAATTDYQLRRIPTALVLEAGAAEAGDFRLREHLRPPEAPVYTVVPGFSPQQLRTFFGAVAAGDIPDVYNQLLKEPRLVHAVDSSHDEPTPLHAAVLARDAKMMEYLIRCGADVNAGNREGSTPLTWAVCQGNADLVRRLTLDFGAALDAADVNGCTPLAIAVSHELPEMEALLAELQRAPRKPPREPAPVGWDLRPVSP